MKAAKPETPIWQRAPTPPQRPIRPRQGFRSEIAPATAASTHVGIQEAPSGAFPHEPATHLVTRHTAQAPSDAPFGAGRVPYMRYGLSYHWDSEASLPLGSAIKHADPHSL